MKNVLLLSIFCLPAVLFAFAGGDGSVGNPYQIQTPADLTAVNNNLTAHYILVSDINMVANSSLKAIIAPDTGSSSDYTFSGTPFSGTFDGNGHKISNLALGTVASSANDYIGLFGKLNGASVTNLVLDNFSVKGNHYTAVLAGYSNAASISDCAIIDSDLNAKTGSTYVGLLTGIEADCTISGCSVSDGLLTVTDCSYCSFMAGYALRGTILNCSAEGTAYLGNSTDEFGAIVGYVYNSSLILCKAVSVITAGESCWYIGGVAGQADYANVGACMAAGRINADDGSMYLGGLVGYIYYGSYNSCFANTYIQTNYQCQSIGGFAGKIAYGPVNNSYCVGGINTDYLSDDIGGFTGQLFSSDISHSYSSVAIVYDQYTSSIGGFTAEVLGSSTVDQCFWDTQVSGLASSTTGTGASTVQMKDDTLFLNAGWDFIEEEANGLDDYWYMRNFVYPRLDWQPQPGDINANGLIDSEDAILMAAQWLEDVDDFETFAADIDMSGFVDYVDLSVLANNRSAL